jgi:RNA polymerase sigma factor (sigma-70 family)
MEPTSEQLMVEMGWVRRLAQALLHDDSAADDVAQETWLVAAAKRPDEHRALRPWLASVVRNLVRTRRRGEARRDERETAYEYAGGRTVATPAELIERIELQRVVAGEVLALAEPYRSTVLLHFVEGLTSVEIARRLGVPNGTVRRRLKTALDQLRECLRARTDQPRRGWLAALVPLANAPVPGTPPPTLLGAVLMKKIIAIAVVLALLLAGALLWKVHGGPSRDLPAATAVGQQPQPRSTGARREPGQIPEWAIQAGAPTRRIAGHVISEGVPVAGATVRLGLQISRDLVQPLVERTSAADGAFDFGMQPAAQFTVSAQSEAHISSALTVSNADPRAKSDQLVVVLEDCRARKYGRALMSGTVSDASGGGISKAHLSIDGLAGADTDATGHYSLCLSPVENDDVPHATVRIDAEGYGTTTQRVIVAGELHQDFVMVPEAVLVGRVVTADDRPVAGARVLAEPDAIEGPHHVASSWTESDADGHFRIAGLAPGKFHLSAAARSAGSALPLVAIARATATSKELRLVVVPLARVTGRVVMSSAPVAGALVAAARPGAGPQQLGTSATSQADGTFTLDGVPFGTVALSAAPFSVSTPATLDVKRAQIDGVVLDVRKLATLRGHILRKGKPVPGAEVRFLPAAAPPVYVKSGADGAYAFEGLPAGDGRVYAWSVSAKAFMDERLVHLGAGEDHTEDIELDLAAEVKGTVVDEAGTPVPGVYVNLDGNGNFCEAMTDDAGDFDCASIAGGDYAPRVAPSPSAGQEFAPAVGDKLPMITVPKDTVLTGVRLAIKHETLSIRGTVVDDVGIAVPDVHVEAIGHGYPVMSDLASVMTDANGKFEIGKLARGSYNLHAHAADGSEAEVLGIATPGDSVTITLARPGAIEGTLVGFSTTPVVETATLTADLHIGGDAVVEGNTFSQVGMRPGRYTVEAKAGLEIDGATVEVRSGETTHVTLTSRGAGRVEGTVIELGTKAPVVGMRCDGNLSMGGQMSSSPPDESRQAYTDAAGHFSVATPTGRVRVFCFNPTPTPAGGMLSVAGTDVDVVPGTVPHVDLVAVRATFAVPPPKVGFDLIPMTLPITVNTVDPAGPAAAAGVAPGDHLVTIDGQSLQGMLPQGATFMLLNHHAGSAMTLGLERSGAARTAKIVAR